MVIFNSYVKLPEGKQDLGPVWRNPGSGHCPKCPKVHPCDCGRELRASGSEIAKHQGWVGNMGGTGYPLLRQNPYVLKHILLCQLDWKRVFLLSIYFLGSFLSVSSQTYFFLRMPTNGWITWPISSYGRSLRNASNWSWSWRLASQMVGTGEGIPRQICELLGFGNANWPGNAKSEASGSISGEEAIHYTDTAYHLLGTGAPSNFFCDVFLIYPTNFSNLKQLHGPQANGI